MAQWHDAKVVERVDWNSHLFSLRFSCSGFPAFIAGQFAKIGIKQNDGKVLSRPYSLVNSPDADLLEVIAVPVEDGNLSPQLQQLHEGDTLKIMSPATGFLVLNEVPPSKHLFFLATGTGVGPFVSILDSPEVWQKYEKIVLVYAVRKYEDLAYLDNIQICKKRYPEQFIFVPIVSRESHSNTLMGRIPQLITSQKIQKFAGVDITHEDAQVMLCGNPDMIKEAMPVLEEFGLKKHLRRSPGQISMERYW